MIKKSWILTSYQEVLSKFLYDKPVLIVAACSSKTSISVESIKKSDWLMYQAKLANIKIENLNVQELTHKNGKATSAMLYDNRKYIVLMMGSNNLPSLKN